MSHLNLSGMSDTAFDAFLARLVREEDRMFDPETGREWPLIRGGADGGDDDEGDDDDDGDEDEDDAAARAAEAKIRRTAAKAAKRDLVRSLGFGNVGDLKAALARLADSGEGDESDDDPAKPPKPAPKVRPAVEAVAPEVLAGRVAVELASAGIDPAKVKRATRIVLGDIEAGDSPSDEDIADLIDDLRDSEPAWFQKAGSDDGDAGTGRGVPGPVRTGKRRQPDPATRGAEIYRQRAERHREFKLPTIA